MTCEDLKDFLAYAVVVPHSTTEICIMLVYNTFIDWSYIVTTVLKPLETVIGLIRFYYSQRQICKGEFHVSILFNMAWVS